MSEPIDTGMTVPIKKWPDRSLFLVTEVITGETPEGESFNVVSTAGLDSALMILRFRDEQYSIDGRDLATIMLDKILEDKE